MKIVMCNKCSIKMTYNPSIQGYICTKCNCMKFIYIEPKKKHRKIYH